MTVEPFSIDNEAEADAYLNALLANPEYRSIGELELRSDKYIKNEKIRKYFLNKGKEMLKPTAR